MLYEAIKKIQTPEQGAMLMSESLIQKIAEWVPKLSGGVPEGVLLLYGMPVFVVSDEVAEMVPKMSKDAILYGQEKKIVEIYKLLKANRLLEATKRVLTAGFKPLEGREDTDTTMETPHNTRCSRGAD